MAPEARTSTTGGSGERRLTTEYVAARALLDASSIEEAASRILQAICESLGWEHGALWTVDREGECLRCAQIWSVSDSRFSEFRAVSQGMTFQRGIGLPGRVWRNASSAWIPDVVADTNFPRAPIAAREGLHAAFAFPVLLRGEVFGVMEFFSREIREPDEHLLPMLTAVGDQIGMFIERQRAQEELSRFFALSLDMLCVAGFDGYFKRVNPAWEKVLGYTEAELLSRPYMDFVHPDDREATRVEAKKLADGLSVMSFENRYYHKDGTLRWLLWASAPFQDQRMVYAAARDITEQKAAEELRARNTQLELLDAKLAALTDAGELRDVVDRISDIAQAVLPHDAMVLPVLLPDRAHVRFHVTRTPDGAKFPEVMEIPEHLRNSEWDHDLVDDLQSDPAQRNFAAAKLGYRSALRVPIRVEGQLAAGVGFFSFTPSAYKSADIPVARRVADRLALSLLREKGIEAAKRADEASARASTLEARVRALTEELDARSGYRRVVGESPQWRQVLTQATQVAATETTVLLLGESGTGKEVVARFLHRASPRSNGPFVALNCAALPEQLLEAELFGYERGAFTGATQSKPGQLEQAAGGTLFLDEVAEMSPSAQAKFLRVLQEREFKRLGGTRTLRTDARVVAATNRDLQRAMVQGQFREDLYYRLNVFAIGLPPLRDRRDDILPLSEAFLTELGRGLGRPPGGISREARQVLVQYHWPGNVRELRNILERAAILCDGGLITAEHLALNVSPPPIRSPGPPLASVATELAAAAAPAAPVRPSSAGDLSTMERAMIEQALQSAHFNKSKAAKTLGLTRKQLYVRMRKYGFDPG
jgi:two-component system response regulator FlrC